MSFDPYRDQPRTADELNQVMDAQEAYDAFFGAILMGFTTVGTILWMALIWSMF